MRPKIGERVRAKSVGGLVGRIGKEKVECVKFFI